MPKWTRERFAVPGLLACLLMAAALAPPVRALFAGADAWDWATRDTWQRPQEVMDELGIKTGSTVADVGCGDGYFTFRLADRVGPNGRVYAVDIQADQIKKIRQQASERKLPQITGIVGDSDNPHLPAGSLDGILVVKAYHEFDAYDAMLDHFLTALKPGGRLAVIDYIGEPAQSRSEYSSHHRIPPGLVQQEVERDGFSLIHRESDIRIPDDSRVLFFLLFDRPSETVPGKN